MPALLSEITGALGGELCGQDRLIERLAPLETAGPAALAFVSHPKYAKLIDTTQAAALIVSPALLSRAVTRGSCVVHPDPYLYFARLTQWWRRRQQAQTAPSIHPTACVAPGALVATNVTLGPFVCVGEGVVVGEGSRLGPHCVLETGSQVGRDCQLGAHVTVGADCILGDRCILHAGVVIGADGFGFAPHEGAWVKIEQLGAVRVGNDVEIGANSCVDRGALDDTVLEDGVKLDNLVQIGHNVRVGRHTAMAGCAGVAGSAVIGEHCTVGGGAVVLGHLTLADHVHISAATVVTRSLLKPGQYSGVFPIDDNASWEKNAATLKQLHALRDRIKRLEKP